MTRTAALAAALLLAACDGPLLFAEVEVPEVRVTLPPQAFPAFDVPDPADWCDPTSPQTSPPCVAVAVSYDLSAQLPTLEDPGVSYELRLTDLAFRLSATQSQPGAPPDLSGVARAYVLVGEDPSVPGSGTVVASYVRPPAAAPLDIAVSGNANLDLAPYVAAGALPVRVQVVVDAGTAAFDADIEAAFHLVISVDWGSYL